MKYLLCGDPHFTYSELNECEKFGQFLIDQVRKNDVMPIFLGDQFHTHSSISLPVLTLWKSIFKELSGYFIALVGNHDQEYAGAVRNSMSVFDNYGIIVNKPVVINDTLFTPYMKNSEDFIKTCNDNKTHTVICHQTFNGSRYESGFYATGPDCIEPDLVPQHQIISGHLHTPQEFGKVWYPGAPRWRTLSDANVDRALWIVDITNAGVIRQQGINTSSVCKKIWYFEQTPENITKIDFNGKDEYRVDVRGPQSFIDDYLKTFKQKNVKLRTFRTDKKQTLVRESDGIDLALKKWLEEFSENSAISKKELSAIIEDRSGRKI